MFQFPYLRSLVKKNDHCRHLFQRSDWICTSASDKNQETKVIHDRSAGRNFDEFKFTCTGEIHWKKLFQVRFLTEVLTVEERKPAKDYGTLLKSWHLNVSSSWKYFDGESYASENCSVAKKVHKISAHSNQTGTFSQYCYLRYFKEPSKFKSKVDHQESCPQCNRWFCGVHKSVNVYLEGKKSKTKPKEAKGVMRKSKSLMRRVCELCSKILSNRKGLERHMLIHTGEKPFKCDVCLKPFRRKDNCARHKKTAHLFKKPRKPRRRREYNPAI